MVMKARLRHIFGSRQAAEQPREPTPKSSTRWRSPDPELANSRMDHLDPVLVAALNEDRIQTIAKCVGPGLWVVPIFTEPACTRLTAVINHRLQWQKAQPQESPNSMHYAGVVFEPMGLAPVMNRLRETIVEPFRSKLYTEFDALDEDYAFAATYGRGLDHRLGFHVDDSEVTLNVSLGAEHTGGELTFLGRRCPLHRQDHHRPEEEVRVTIPKGHGLLHTGSHRHLVNSVMGERRNLILWCRSNEHRARQDDSSCPAWCGH